MVKIYKYITVIVIFLVLMLISYDVFSRSFEIKTKTGVIPTNRPSPAPYIPFEDKLWNLVNDWKYEQDGYMYMKDKNVCEYAKIRLNANLTKNISHEGFGGDYLYQFGFTSVGENLSQGYMFERSVIKGWLDSPTHKETLDSGYTHSCIKCGGPDNICVQIFASY